MDLILYCILLHCQIGGAEKGTTFSWRNMPVQKFMLLLDRARNSNYLKTSMTSRNQTYFIPGIVRSLTGL